MKKVSASEYEKYDKFIKDTEPCEDAVSREAAIATTDFTDCPNVPIEICKQVTDEVVKRLKSLPPVTPKQRTGKWIKTREWVTPTDNVSDDYQVDVYTCSCCKSEFGVTSCFCSKCGVRMEGVVSE